LGRDEKSILNFSPKPTKKKDHLGDTGLAGRILLKCIKNSGRVRSVFDWPRIETSCGWTTVIRRCQNREVQVLKLRKINFQEVFTNQVYCFKTRGLLFLNYRLCEIWAIKRQLTSVVTFGLVPLYPGTDELNFGLHKRKVIS
jgi:hypothetical protein